MRTYVPENFNVDNVKEVEKLYQSLLDENIPNSPDALRWVRSFRRFLAAVTWP